MDRLAQQVASLERWLVSHLPEALSRPPLADVLGVLHELIDQDLEPDPEGGGQRIVQGVAEDRRISVEDRSADSCNAAAAGVKNQ